MGPVQEGKMFFRVCLVRIQSFCNDQRTFWGGGGGLGMTRCVHVWDRQHREQGRVQTPMTSVERTVWLLPLPLIPITQPLSWGPAGTSGLAEGGKPQAHKDTLSLRYRGQGLP